MNRRVLLVFGLFLFLLPPMLSVISEPLRAQTSPSKVDRQNSEFWKETSRQFTTRSDSQGTLFFFGFFVFLLALTGGLIYFDYYYRKRSQAIIDNPAYLFAELVRAHELTRAEKRFLTDFANGFDLEDPLPLFIEPKYFLAALDDNRYAETHKTIEYLLKKLFDISRTEEPSFDASRIRTFSGATTIIRPPIERDER